MFPDFPKIKEKIIEEIIELIKAQSNSGPLLSSIGRERYFEGNRLSTKTMDGFLNEKEYKLFESKFSIKKEDIIHEGVGAIIKELQKVSNVIKQKTLKMLFDDINEVVERTGNVINCEGKGITPEIFLGAIEKMYIDFDERGNPIMPQFFGHPSMESTIQKLKELENNPIFNKKFENLINKKRKEWHDRESHRKLVD